MSEAKIIDIFHTSIGLILLLEFDEMFIPKAGMVLKNGGQEIEIKSVAFSQPVLEAASGKHLFSCAVNVDGTNIKKGEIWRFDLIATSHN
ncbi:MAG TPA: hypothetical protein PKL37_23125 [Panacibacter sp.]|nr:hypothetical protein [Panacibacter sp.]